jgi:hypothetical protein
MSKKRLIGPDSSLTSAYHRGVAESGRSMEVK